MKFLSRINFKRNFTKLRAIMVILGTISLGIGVGLFRYSVMGNDPFNAMNIAVSSLINFPYAHFLLCLNILLFIIQFFVKPEHIGFGTVVNSVFAGYIVAFTYEILMDKFGKPELLWVRILTLILGVILTSLGLSLYQTADLGIAPYDSFPVALHEKFEKIPYMVFRMLFDGTCALIAFLSGGLIGPGTLVCALGLGPIVSFFDKTVSVPILSKEKRSA